ncbi:Part of AAA domain-containing protein [Lutibacter agarilyticus]|uniref:DNA 3'-5' helicase II n=1 Tax=Lutibacter agarilyticus TaxID=1109740 RepID=A0A238VEB8_9FLAO|nr:AAA family ATPase [Lutibacter agarilyticus]SNR32508.1 Part of AAA domain-containing protein [Lutibacter agarilyticus]
MSILIPYNQLSNEQKGVIRRISRETGNLFVEGPPGSGKTLISLYTLRDMVESSNVRPLLMMYNHSLFGYLSSALSELGIRDNLTIVTKDKFFWNLARQHDIKPENYNAPYEEKYSFLLSELNKKSITKEHGITIVDEVQDLIPEEWDLIKKMSSRVLTLGDFDQGVYKTNLNRESVKNYGIFEALSVIFRFHKNIAKLAKVFSRKNDDLVGKVSKDSQTQPKLIDVNLNNELSKVGEILKEIKIYRKRIGVICPDNNRLEELSYYLNSNNIDHQYYASNRDLRTHDFTSTTPLLVSSFSSKGLEFEHVILFGFDNSSGIVSRLRSENKLRDVIYVSITRTNSNLYIIRTSETVKELKDLKIENEVKAPEISLDDIF